MMKDKEGAMYIDALHNALKKEESFKNTENDLNRLLRETDKDLRENYRRKKRESKSRYQEKRSR